MAVTVDNVRTAYPNGVQLTAQQVQAQIDFVVGVFTPLLTGCNYSTTLQDAILTYLTAHFLAIGHDQGGLVSKRTGESEETYSSRRDNTELPGLGITIYGQQALALDSQKCLAALAANILPARFRVI